MKNQPMYETLTPGVKLKVGTSSRNGNNNSNGGESCRDPVGKSYAPWGEEDGLATTVCGLGRAPLKWPGETAGDPLSFPAT